MPHGCMGVFARKEGGIQEMGLAPSNCTVGSWMANPAGRKYNKTKLLVNFFKLKVYLLFVSMANIVLFKRMLSSQIRRGMFKTTLNPD
jgi:hypothetical protein